MSLEINDLSFYIKKKGPLNLENQMGVKSFIYGPLLMVFCKTLCKQMCLEICIRKNICLKKQNILMPIYAVIRDVLFNT